MKRSLIVTLVLIMAALMVLTACSPSEKAEVSTSPDAEEPAETIEAADEATAPAEEPELLNIATTPHIAATVIWAADEMGFFAEENIEVETTSFPAMAPAIAALASGDIDISYMGVGVHALAAKGQAKIFVMNNLSYGDYFIGNKEKGITDLESLKGKVIAVPKGSTGDMLVTMVLQKNGFNVDDFEIVNMDAAGIVAAMTSGKVDACGIWEPFVTDISTALGDNAVILGRGEEYADDIAFIGSYGASEKMFNEKRDTLVRFTRAYIKASDYLAENPDELIRITLANTEATEESIDAQIAATDLFDGSRVKDVFLDGSALNWYDSLINAMVGTGVVEESHVTPAEFVDLSIVEDATK